LIAHHSRDNLDATLTLMWVQPEQVTASALVALENGRVSDITEKPSLEKIRSHSTPRGALCAPPLYALSPRVLEHVSHVAPSARGEREFPDVLKMLIADGGRVGGQMIEERLTLTDRDDLLAINRHVLRNSPACATIAADLPRNVTVIPPVRIEAGASVDPGCRIGPEAYLESGCRLRTEAAVRRAVVLRGAEVEAGQVVEDVVLASRPTEPRKNPRG